MTDEDAAEYIKELQMYNTRGELLTPANVDMGHDASYDCAFYHAIRALRERWENRERD